MFKMLNPTSWTLFIALGCAIPLDLSGATQKGLEWSGVSVIKVCNETTATYPNTILNETVIEGYVVFTCDIGFEMEVSDHGDAILAICNETSGEWDFVDDQSPNCQRISCQSPPLPAYGDFSDVRGFGETGNYTCSQEYIVDGEVTATCLADGSWSSEPPSCKISCPTSPGSLTTAYLSDGSCIDVSSTEKTWSDADETCVGLNGSLAIITTNETFELFQDILSNVSDLFYSEGYWIGGYEKPSNYSWKWYTTGDSITTFFWDDMEPSDGEKYTRILLNKVSDFKWTAFEYDQNQKDSEGIGYVCQFDSTCSTANMDGNGDAHDSDGKCYFFQNVGFFTWDSATGVPGDSGQPGCKGMGDDLGFLAEIRDQETQDKIQQWGTSRSYWIGAERDESNDNRTWLWVDGSTISTTWWGPKEPNDLDGNEECIDLYEFDGNYFMNDDKCGNLNRFVCQFSAVNSTIMCGDPGVPYRGERDDVSTAPFFPGESIEFTCVDGYEIEGAANIICQTAGTWNASLPSCNALGCDSAPVVDNATLLLSTSTEYRGTAVYGCNEGYELVGNPSIYCGMDGNWSNIEFTCLELLITTSGMETTFPPMATTVLDQTTTYLDPTTLQDMTSFVYTTALDMTTVGHTTSLDSTSSAGELSTDAPDATTSPVPTTVATTQVFTTNLITSAGMTTGLEDSTSEDISTILSQSTDAATTLLDVGTSTMVGTTISSVSTDGMVPSTDQDVFTGMVTSLPGIITSIPTTTMTTTQMPTTPMTTEQMTTTLMTTSPMTTQQITTPPMTTEQMTTTSMTTEQMTTTPMTTSPMTTQQVITPPMTTEQMTTTPMSKEQITTKPMTTTKMTTSQMTATPMTTTPMTTKQMTPAKMTTSQMTSMSEETATSHFSTPPPSTTLTVTTRPATTIGSGMTSATQSNSVRSGTTSPAEPTQTNSMSTTSKVEEPFPVVLVATLASIFGLLFIIIFLICIVVVISSPKSKTSDSHNLLMTHFGPVNGSTDAKPAKDNITSYEDMVNSVFANDEYRDSILNYRPSMPRIASTTSWTDAEGAVVPESSGGGGEPIYAKIYKNRELSVVRFPSTFEESLADKGLFTFDPSKRSDLSPSDLMGTRGFVFEGTE